MVSYIWCVYMQDYYANIWFIIICEYMQSFLNHSIRFLSDDVIYMMPLCIKRQPLIYVINALIYVINAKLFVSSCY